MLFRLIVILIIGMLISSCGGGGGGGDSTPTPIPTQTPTPTPTPSSEWGAISWDQDAWD